MDIVVREVDEEGVGLVIVEDIEGAVGEFVGEVFAFGGEGEVELVGQEVTAGGRSPLSAGDVEVEAVMLGVVGFDDGFVFGAWGEMPFAEVGGFVAVGFEDFSEGGVVWLEALGPVGDEDRCVGDVLAGDEVGDVGSTGVLSGHHGGACGGADGAGGVGVGELDALRGERVDVGCLVEVGAEGASVGPAPVVDEEDDEVLFLGLGEGGGGGEGGAEEECNEEEEFGGGGGWHGGCPDCCGGVGDLVYGMVGRC